ncbi:MAG: hypothetical protein KY439_12045, partial [Actinobacteria bacterium]|nr:hypothetical protein [Actinomycetota bacterium]
MRFTTDERPLLFDLRQRVLSAALDGERVEPSALAPRPTGVREITLPLDEGDHELLLKYEINTP